MFDVGFAELTLLAVLGLLVLGPERLPAVARVIGGYLRKARRSWNTVRAEIEAELAAEDLRRRMQEPLDELDELRQAARDASRQAEPVSPATSASSSSSAKPTDDDEGAR